MLIKGICALLGASLLVGCTTTETIDLSAERANNLSKDMNLLQSSDLLNLDKALSIDEVIRIGIANNLDLRIARLNQDLASGDALEARLKQLPDLNAKYDYSHRSSLPVQDYYNVQTGAPSLSNTVGRLKSTRTAELELNWNILDFGLSYISSRQAGYQSQIMRMKRVRQSQLLALDLTEAYWRAVLAEDALKYIEGIRDMVGQYYNAVDQALVDNSINALTGKEFQKRLIELEIGVRDLQAQLANSRIILSRLMGLKQGTAFKLQRPDIYPVLKALPAPIQLDSGFLETYALHNRSELYSGDLKEAIDRDQVWSSMLKMFPNLALSAGLNYDGNELLHQNNWSTVGYSVSWNLLNLPANYAAYNNSKLAKHRAQIERLQLTVGVLTQVHLGLLDYNIALDRFELFERKHKVTDELLEIVRQQIDNKQMPTMMLARRLIEQMEARLQRDQAIVDSIVSHRRLLVSVGMSPYDWKNSLDEIDNYNQQLRWENEVATEPDASEYSTFKAEG